MTDSIRPVRQSVDVAVDPATAFAVFTGSMGRWWPRTHVLVEDDELADVVIEPREGGRLYQITASGRECDWGRVLTWDPPARFAFSWQLDETWTHDPDADRASTVEVVFHELGDGSTRVDLEHRGFERHGAGGRSIADAVARDNGWPELLGLFADHEDLAATRAGAPRR